MPFDIRYFTDEAARGDCAAMDSSSPCASTATLGARRHRDNSPIAIGFIIRSSCGHVLVPCLFPATWVARVLSSLRSLPCRLAQVIQFSAQAMSLPPLPAGLDFGESVVTSNVTVEAVLRVMAFLAVILRFVARRVGRLNYWWDDWLILVLAVRNSTQPMKVVC